MTLTYSEIFTERGDRYHAAMVSQPDARAAEFDAVFASRPLSAGERLLDVPAGGGYLGRRVPRGVEVVGFELTEGFGAGVPLYGSQVPWLHGAFDRAVCLAALHHIDDKHGFLRSLASRLVPGGLLHLGDVPAGSPLTAFLDGFVGRYNTTGHAGSYLEADVACWSPLGRVLRMREEACPWHFADDAAMLDFCAALFGLVGCPADALGEALDRHVGIRRGDGRVSLQWRLLYIDIEASAR